MRRRSGGLHSEDYEGYLEVRTSLLQLCQTAESKLGVFYDESPKRKNLARRLKSQPAALSTPKDTFNDFEFDRTNECLTEQRKLSDLSITTVNVMLVIPAGSDVSTGCALASGCLAADLLAELLERYRTLPECSVDLLIRNFKRDLDELVLKVWVVYRSELPLFESTLAGYHSVLQEHLDLFCSGRPEQQRAGRSREAGDCRSVWSYLRDYVHLRPLGPNFSTWARTGKFLD